MLKAYLRRYDGVTQPVTVQHQGQHLGVSEGKVRFARLFWERDGEARDDGEEAAYGALEEATPLLDTLIVTRVSQVNGERAVFHGTVTEVSSDRGLLSVTAVDNPAQERLYDQPWWNDAPLYPSDQAAPEAQAGAFASSGGPQAPHPQAGQQMPPQGAQTLGGLPLGQALSGVQIGVAGRPHPSDDPAARPGGHPAAHPAAAPPVVQWQRAPEGAAAASQA